jgi:hypothetical protein
LRSSDAGYLTRRNLASRWPGGNIVALSEVFLEQVREYFADHHP